MSRSIHEVNGRLFSKLFAYANCQKMDNLARYIPISSEPCERRKFTHLKLLIEIKPTLNTQFSIFQVDDVDYFILTGDVEYDFNTPELTLEQITNEIYIAVLDELDISIKRNTYESNVLDYIAIDFAEENYQGHDFEALQDFFPKFSIYKLVSDVNKAELIYQYAIQYFINNPDYTLLPFSSTCLDAYRIASISISNLVPLDNLLRSLSASSWSHCFLDIYKYLEYLFETANVHKHFQPFENNISLSFEDFHRYINKNLNESKPKEDCTIKYLLSLIPEETKSILVNYKNSPEEKENTFVYGLRNNIVHYRTDTIATNLNFSKEKWNAIISFLLSILPFLYNKFNSVIIQE